MDDTILPLILIDAQKNLIVYTDEKKPKPEPGMMLVYHDSNAIKPPR
jgi:hypothetical protein